VCFHKIGILVTREAWAHGQRATRSKPEFTRTSIRLKQHFCPTKIGFSQFSVGCKKICLGGKVVFSFLFFFALLRPAEPEFFKASRVTSMRAASGGALAPEPPRATRSKPEFRGARRQRALARRRRTPTGSDQSHEEKIGLSLHCANFCKKKCCVRRTLVSYKKDFMY